jgi:hypothetical protein
VLRRVSIAILLLLLISATPSQAQQPADSVFYVDSLVPSLMRIEHKPFRAGASLNYGWNRFDTIGYLPPAMSEGCDSAYGSGSGTSIQGGIHIEYPA